MHSNFLTALRPPKYSTNNTWLYIIDKANGGTAGSIEITTALIGNSVDCETLHKKLDEIFFFRQK